MIARHELEMLKIDFTRLERRTEDLLMKTAL
jgi:hypothetical protein